MKDCGSCTEVDHSIKVLLNVACNAECRMLGVSNDCLREAGLLCASHRGKRTKGRHFSFLIEREVVTSRCNGNKVSGSQQTEVLQIWYKNDMYTVFSVHDCTH